MKRTLSAFLAMLFLLSFMTLPVTVYAKEPTVYTPDYFRVFVPKNEAKKLQLEWDTRLYSDDEILPTAFEVYRSDSGENGTYKKIATTKETEYTDTGLKNGKVYYYRVRGLVKRGGKIYYNKFSKDNECTKLTNNQTTKLLQKAYRMAGMWMDLAQPNCSSTKYIKSLRTITYDNGETASFEGEFFIVTNKSITTKKQLKKYLGKVFDQAQVNDFVDKLYVEKNGRLWMFQADWGDGAGPFAERDKVIYVSQTWDRMKFVNICNWGNDVDLFCDPIIHDLEFRNGRWIFTDEYWFRYHHFINLEP